MRAKMETEMNPAPIAIGADLTLDDAQEVMRSWGMRHLPVLEGEKLVGVVSERDILRAFAAQKPGKTEVRAVMSKNPYHVDQTVSVAEVAKTMADNKYGCAIVTSSRGNIIGIFTTTDALNLLARIMEKPSDIDIRAMQLRDYLAKKKTTN